MTDPGPGTNWMACSGSPASSSSATNLAAMTAVGLAGLNTTGLPQTSAAAVMPAMIASGKFHGGMTTPVPSGI